MSKTTSTADAGSKQSKEGGAKGTADARPPGKTDPGGGGAPGQGQQGSGSQGGGKK